MNRPLNFKLFSQLERLLLIFTLTSIFFLLGSLVGGDVHAALNASSSYNIRVKISPKGIAEFEYMINLVNESEGFFIRDYSLISDHRDLIDLKVFENGRLGDFRKEHVDRKVRIKILLQSQLIKSGDETDFYIQYKTREVYKKDGLLWRVYIPPIKSEEDLYSTNFTLTIPSSLGEISYVSIKGGEFAEQGDNKIFSYTQSDAPFGVLLLFGDKQQYDFVYKYKLENKSSERKRFSINLPPDSDFQKVYFLDASYSPDRALTDRTGNNAVEYLLGPQENREIRIAGIITYSLSEEGENLNADTLEKYLQPTEVWDFESDDVRAVINKVTRQDYFPYENASLIYEYLILNFDYLESGVSQRRDVVHLLNEKSKLSCLNYADLFVTLARGVGIPAREVIGYSTWSPDLNALHSWVEFYDESQDKWVAADPCLEKRIGFSEFEDLDLDRVILAYRGVSDSAPEVISPFNKFQDLDSDNLEINVSSYEYIKDSQQVGFNYKLGQADLFFTNLPLTFFVTNNSQSIFSFNNVEIDDQKVGFMSKHVDGDYHEAVFPGQYKEISINLSQLKTFSVEKIENYSLEVMAKFGGSYLLREYEFEIKRPFTWLHVAAWLTAGVLASITLACFLLLVKKLRTKPWKKIRRYKYKFRKSRIKGLLDVPVSLR